MAWKRRGGRLYFYRSRRVRGRVASEYLGSGPAAELAEAIGDRYREQRDAERARSRAIRKQLDDRARLVAPRCRLVELILGWALERAGFHQHDRGPWRKRRMAIVRTSELGELPEPLTAEEIDAARDVFIRASEGDQSTLPALRRLFDAKPDAFIEFSRGNLADLAERTIIDDTAGKNEAFREGMRRQAAKLRAELGWPKASGLERLLIDRIVLCWLDLHSLETMYHQNANKMPQGALALWDRRRTQAHNRFLSATRALQAVRKIGLPTTAIQMNLVTMPPEKANQTGA